MAKKQEDKKNNTKKIYMYTGTVVNNKVAKTIRVKVETKMAHPIYKRIIKRHKNYLVHTDKEVEMGATVLFRETSPISKRKKWVLVKVLGTEK